MLVWQGPLSCCAVPGLSLQPPPSCTCVCESLVSEWGDFDHTYNRRGSLQGMCFYTSSWSSALSGVCESTLDCLLCPAIFPSMSQYTQFNVSGPSVIYTLQDPSSHFDPQ